MRAGRTMRQKESLAENIVPHDDREEQPIGPDRQEFDQVVEAEHRKETPMVPARRKVDARYKRPALDEDCLSSRRRLATCVMLSLALSGLLWSLFTLSTCSSLPKLRGLTSEWSSKGSVEHHWAQYSPYFDAGDYKYTPRDCAISQVNILQRHGARYPTSSAGKKYQAAIEKLQSANFSSDPRLAFLQNYTYDLGTDVLVPLGALQSYEAGGREFERYSELVDGNDEAHVPFVRSSSASRCVDSATNWTSGFASASSGTVRPILNLILQESGNDTLDDNMCPAQPDLTDEYVTPWETIYATPIADRLNTLAPGANLSASDVTNLFALCAFESVKGNFTEGEKVKESDVCGLFEDHEFEGFEYDQDLDKYYGTGYGNPLGRVQGVGYVNELLARLTNTPVNDSTQTNRTLDSSSSTFPLNRTIYADFSHDNQMAAIYAALGLFNDTQPLPADFDVSTRKWKSSRMVPFSGRLVTERVECDGTTFVRMFVDDASMDLGFCGAGWNGMCTLDAFVESQAYARAQGMGDFEKCQEDST